MDKDQVVRKLKAKFPLIGKKLSEIFVNYYWQNNQIKQKFGFRDLITQVDKKIESSFRKSILGLFPDHKVIGEESFDQIKGSNREYIWYIDPIDGTTNYIHHYEECAIMIGLLYKSQPIFSWIYFPIKNEEFLSILGEGSFFNNQKIIPKVKHLGGWQKVLVGVLEIENFNHFKKMYANIWNNCQGVRIPGCSAALFCKVATSEIDMAILPDSFIWEYIPGLLLISESGFYFKVINGQSQNLYKNKKINLIISSNNELLNEAVKLTGRINY